MNLFLLGIDLEDVSLELCEKYRYTDRVPVMTERILTFLSSHRSSATFFTTGDIARKFPALIHQIVQEGHEIACHSDLHKPVNSLNEEQFKQDLDINISSLLKAGANEIKGYRAPFYSLTRHSQWVYDCLNEAGINYSSSVLPASNPLHGWKEFGENIRPVSGVLEIPVTIFPYPFLKIPFAGGIYFRVFPGFLLGHLLKHSAFKDKPVVGYLHPQDIDNKGEKLVYRGYNALYNFLLNFNKSSVLKKLDCILNTGINIIRYDTFASNWIKAH